MCAYEQILMYIFVELYKINNTGSTKQNLLELRDKYENKHQGFFYFMHHGPCIASMYCTCMLENSVFRYCSRTPLGTLFSNMVACSGTDPEPTWARYYFLSLFSCYTPF